MISINIAARTGGFVAALLALVLSGCATTGSLEPFSTDGCSLFPDRALIGESDWCQCCAAHDLAYWRGGTAEARLLADQQLAACVLKASGSDMLSSLMFEGVRLGGGPYFYTPFRWAYGWPYTRAYEPLSPTEEALAASLEQAYRARDPLLSCPIRATTND
jgi:hypothetical protein